jgi:hypothetical protein
MHDKINNINNLIGLILIIFLINLIIGCRKQEKWKEKVKFNDESIITVHNNYSENPGFIIRDVLSVGGGNELYKIRFKYKGKEYLWESKSRTFILNAYKNALYIMILDTETDIEKICFRFYKYNNKWIEITAKEFPKEISIENMGLSNSKKKIINSLITDRSSFKRTLTAKLWLRLEKGIKFYEAPYYVDSKFLEEYKKKYIKRK